MLFYLFYNKISNLLVKDVDVDCAIEYMGNMKNLRAFEPLLRDADGKNSPSLPPAPVIENNFIIKFNEYL